MRRGPKPTYVRVRVELFELHIGRCIALGRDEGTVALRFLARQAGADPSETEIAKHVEMYRKELAYQRSRNP